MRLQRLNLDLKFLSAEKDPDLHALIDNLAQRKETFSKAVISKSNTPQSTATLLSKLTTPARLRASHIPTEPVCPVSQKSEQQTAYEIKADLDRTDFSYFDN